MFRIFISLIFLPILAWAHPAMELEQAYLNKGKDYTPRTQHLDKQGRAKFVNHLILESSPYLLQHAHNPVNWYGFSDEAFDKAKLENKPIFISIGYATCHWCHVMEEESFDDIEVAKFLNKYFISIKVDREIRPDVDATYMNVSQLINGSGGWPLNAVILPDGKAFFAGTYFPKPQLLDILSQIQTLWKNEKDSVINQANEIDNILNKAEAKTQSSIDKSIIPKAIQALLSNFDEMEGGFGEAPKFPHESMLLLLIDEQKRNPNDEQLNAITATLDIMASGGFYDTLGGGFHRYSTDNTWLIPHFEKMLYNQAQLSLVYTRAYQLTHKPLYRRIAQQTLNYVLKEMQDINGGFFSATDADSEGEEGTFFVWSISEIKRVLNKDEFKRFNQWFDLSSHTDFEGNHVIRFRDINDVNVADYKQIDALLIKLYNVRIKREPPLTDNKVLLSWNALMIPSLLEAGEVFSEEKYTDAGLALANYLESFNKNNQLYRVSINSKLETNALFEDYAYLANAYLSVFDQTHEKIWLNRTVQLVNTMNEKFWDKERFGYNMTNNNKYLNARYKESYDGAIPSANGIAYQVLVKLNNRTAEPAFIQRAKQLLGAFSADISQDPYSYSSFILGFNNATFTEIANVQYAYQGRIRVQTQTLKNNEIAINLDLNPLWHVNSNQPLQDSLIATKVNNMDVEHWTITKASYPKGKLAKLGFSKDKISIYKDQVSIKLSLSQRSKDYVKPSLSLTLQACSDKVCLPPTTLTLKP
ncbi:MAG: thioredoxin [Candidatus Thioglobus sp.]|nr:MAG: thioredoxin [Candidatus Thioglobus sp.]RUM86105.1 MAG: thioredoxin [Candidatus Thioglobus sp.]